MHMDSYSHSRGKMSMSFDVCPESSYLEVMYVLANCTFSLWFELAVLLQGNELDYGSAVMKICTCLRESHVELRM